MHSQLYEKKTVLAIKSLWLRAAKNSQKTQWDPDEVTDRMEGIRIDKQKHRESRMAFQLQGGPHHSIARLKGKGGIYYYFFLF